jgi:hypothetical protein
MEACGCVIFFFHHRNSARRRFRLSDRTDSAGTKRKMRTTSTSRVLLLGVTGA